MHNKAMWQWKWHQIIFVIKMIWVINSIPWVRCASGNVYKRVWAPPPFINFIKRRAIWIRRASLSSAPAGLPADQHNGTAAQQIDWALELEAAADTCNAMMITKVSHPDKRIWKHCFHLYIATCPPLSFNIPVINMKCGNVLSGWLQWVL